MKTGLVCQVLTVKKPMTPHFLSIQILMARFAFYQFCVIILRKQKCVMQLGI